MKRHSILFLFTFLLGMFVFLHATSPHVEAQTCGVTAPVGLSPAGNVFYNFGTANTINVTFTWDKVTNADSYWFRLDDTPGTNSWSNDCAHLNTGDVCRTLVGNASNSVTIPLTKNHQYRWWVHGVKSNCGGSATAATLNVGSYVPLPTATPTPAFRPPSNLQGSCTAAGYSGHVVVSWSPVPAATYGYEVQFKFTPPGKPAYYLGSHTGNTSTTTDPPAGSIVEWSVASQRLGENSAFATGPKITCPLPPTPTPTLPEPLPPPNSTIRASCAAPGTVANFSWAASTSPGVTSYDVFLGVRGGGSEHKRVTGTSTTYSPTKPGDIIGISLAACNPSKCSYYVDGPINGPVTCVATAPTVTKTPTPTPTRAACSVEGQICGGLINKLCCTGFTCKITAPYPDASGTCIPSTTITKTVTVSPGPVCLCGTNNSCDTSCSFSYYSTTDINNVSYIKPPGCSLSSVPFSSSITQTAKNQWCQRSKRTMGDATGDGQIDDLDYFYYVQAVSGGTLPSDTAQNSNVNPDFNGNGSVGTDDRIIIVHSLQPAQ